MQLSNANTDYSFLYFYNRFCGACPKVVHELQSFRDLYNGSIGLIGICIGDNDVDAIHTNMIDHDYSPQYSIDSLKQTWASFNLFTVPSTIILDSDGIIIGGFQGYDKNMKRDIKKLIKEYDGSF